MVFHKLCLVERCRRHRASSVRCATGSCSSGSCTTRGAGRSRWRRRRWFRHSRHRSAAVRRRRCGARCRRWFGRRLQVFGVNERLARRRSRHRRCASTSPYRDRVTSTNERRGKAIHKEREKREGITNRQAMKRCCSSMAQRAPSNSMIVARPANRQNKL
jgi:hypothetical protein